MLDIHDWLGNAFAIGLGYSFRHGLGHGGRGITDVDLAAGDIIVTAIERDRFGQTGYRVLGRGIGCRETAAEHAPKSNHY